MFDALNVNEGKKENVNVLISSLRIQNLPKSTDVLCQNKPPYTKIKNDKCIYYVSKL